MEIKLGRDMEPVEAGFVKLIIGENEYRFTENTVTGRLIINKYNNGDGETSIAIVPKVGNEIEII